MDVVREVDTTSVTTSSHIFDSIAMVAALASVSFEESADSAAALPALAVAAVAVPCRDIIFTEPPDNVEHAHGYHVLDSMSPVSAMSYEDDPFVKDSFLAGKSNVMTTVSPVVSDAEWMVLPPVITPRS